jgi:hypothetical protein
VEVDEQVDALRRKLAFVDTKLVDKYLRQRYFFKSLARVPSFLSLDWTINVTYFHGEDGESPFPYVSCLLEYQKAAPMSEFDKVFGQGKEALKIDFTLDEVEYLIKTFKAIKLKLSPLVEGE